LQVPALMPSNEQVSNAIVMKQRMYAYLDDLVPSSIRGRELMRGMGAMGAVTMTIIEYENVTVNELNTGATFNHDNIIRVTFKRDDCRGAVGQ
jgi:hypothetical protein